jgi:integrase
MEGWATIRPLFSQPAPNQATFRRFRPLSTIGLYSPAPKRSTRAALNRARKERRVDFNAAADAEVPTVQRKEIQVFTLEEARRFLAAASGHRLEGLFTAALSLGLRINEALGLTWDDVDLDGATLTVKKHLQRVESKLCRVDVKSKASRRELDIPDVCVVALTSPP